MVEFPHAIDHALILQLDPTASYSRTGVVCCRIGVGVRWDKCALYQGDERFIKTKTQLC